MVQCKYRNRQSAFNHFQLWQFQSYSLPTILRILNEQASLVYFLSLSVVYTIIVAWGISLFVEVWLEMTAPRSRPSPSVSNKKAKRQKQCRRKSSLMKKACEYSKMCDADVCLGIRLRETGQVFILSADASGFWSFLGTQLVRHQWFRIETLRQLTSPGLTLPEAETSNGRRSFIGLKRIHYSGVICGSREQTKIRR